VSDEYHSAVLRRDGALRHAHVVAEGNGGILDDTDVDLAVAGIVSSFLHRMSNDYGFPAHRRVRTRQYQGYARCPSGDRHRA